MYSMDDLAELVKQALAAEDVTGFADLLDPNVTWGAPGSANPTCQNRKQVINWYERARGRGVRGNVRTVDVMGDRLLVTMTVQGSDDAQERGGTALRYQVLTMRDGRIADIAGFDDRADALAFAS